MGVRTVAGFITTSEPIPAYGGMTLAPDLMPQLAEDLRAGRVPLTLQHDARRRLDPRLLHVDVRETDKGALGVWVEFEVDEEEWPAADDYHGFSIAVVGNPVEPDPSSDKPILMLAADAGHFDEETYQAAVAQLHPYFAVGGGQLYQFSEIVPAKVVVDLVVATLAAIPANLIASVLYDVLKTRFLKPKGVRETVFSFTIREGDRSTQAHLETGDAEVLGQALATVRDLAMHKEPARSFEFDRKKHEWKRLR